MVDHNERDNDPDLFAGTADYYRDFRVPYPKVLIDSLTAELCLDGTGTLLDVGCGTGEVIEAIGGQFARVLGIDPDPGMLAQVSGRVQQPGFEHVKLRSMKAEDISSLGETYRMVTFGASFHWTHRISAARSVKEMLDPGGVIVLLGSNSPWTGQEKWQEIALGQLKSYLGEQRRAGGGHFEESSLRHQEILEQAGYSDVRTVDFDVPHTWTLENFIGYLYSTSFASREVLGDRASAFESGLRKALLDYDSNGTYQETMHFYYIYGKK